VPVYPLDSPPTRLVMGYLSNTDTCLAARVSLCLFYSHLSFRDLFIFAEYEILTAVLVDTKLWGNYLFWGMTPSAKTTQLVAVASDMRAVAAAAAAMLGPRHLYIYSIPLRIGNSQF